MIAERVEFETGPLSVWFYHALSAEGLPAICIDAGHPKSALDMTPNKTDAADAGRSGRAEFRVGTVENTPLPDVAFDKALIVHAI
ncbi:hypothetical protein [Mesorhizobium sp. LNHC209A00]|uniref:hypothetical protein n=1 Tax=Mesorhizobium sp. LNHC209A00 TaxID=1287226 RepID=UPI0003CFB86A|nr:hypothetical protein [Mesorhizobium sp. LNHC209A00]ESY91884.1 hypothetical protein X738_27830 [Mesorhizobium sp. LNHC209A00]